MKLYYVNVVLLLFIYSAVTDAAILDPIHAHHLNNPPGCGLICPRSLPLFIRHEAPYTYVYKLESKTLINVNITGSVEIAAKVEINVKSGCEYELQLRKVVLSGVPNSGELSRQLEINPLQFGYFDGKVQGVCPSVDEEVWTLNVKKSIISALQMRSRDITNPSNEHEDDFSGHCLTSYEPIRNDDSSVVIIRKTKNLNECEHRRKSLSGFNSRSLSMITELLRRKASILKSTSTCTQYLKDSIITSVSCSEQNTLSFQTKSIVSSSLNLKFVEKVKSTAGKTQTVSEPQNLYMSHKKDPQKEALESDVLSQLATICTQVSDNISPETTKSFHSLVQSLKTLSGSATERIDAAVKSGEICTSPKLRYLFISASAFAASDPSIQTIIKGYNNKEFSETRSTVLFSLIALKSKPTEKTVDALLPLLQSKETARPLILGISLLINNFCETHQNCEENTAVKQSVEELLKRLKTSECNLERITVLKSLENIVITSNDAVISNVVDVAKNEAMDSGVRVAAIQILTKLADDNVREKLIQILLKDTEEVDVRIAAYKTVVASGAKPEQWEQIRSVNDAKIKTYIQTHVKNIKNTRNVYRRVHLLGRNPQQFDEPNLPSIPIGITRNFQYVPTYKGPTIEGDVIHPKGSLIPSWITFNIMAPIHGVEKELIEVSLRQVGLDAHLKKMIGRGISGPEITLRIAEEIMEFIEHIKDPMHAHNTILQLSVKISGRNVLFVDTLEDIHVLTTLFAQRIKRVSQLDSLDAALGAVLLDSVVEIPTLNGFPMVVHLNDTVLTGVKASFTKETTNPNSVTKKVRANRSLIAELSAGLNIEVANYRPGFEYRLQFAFTPTVDALIEVTDSRIFKMKLNLPNEKTTVIRIKQSTRLIDPNGQLKGVDELIDNGQESEENTRCINAEYGLSICRVRTPVKDSPVPNVEIYLSKKDKSLEAIEYLLERPPKGSQEVKTWSARINAINSEVYKVLSAELSLLTPSEGQKEASFILKTPKKTHSFRAALLSDRDGLNTNLELDINCPENLELKVKHIVNKTAEQRNVDLRVDYKLINGKPESFKLLEKVSLNFKRSKKTKLINVSFFVEMNSTQFPQYNNQIGYYTQLRPYQNSKSELTIGWDQDFKKRIRISHNSKMDVTEVRPFQMNSQNAIIIEATPFGINYDFKLDFNVSAVKGMPKSLKVDLVGKDVNGGEDKEVRGVLEFERTDSPLYQKVSASLKYPGRELAYQSEVKQIKDLSFAGQVKYQWQKGKVITIDHKESITNPTRDFKFESSSEVSYSYKPDKYSYSTFMGYLNSDTIEYRHSMLHDGKKINEWLITLINRAQLKAYVAYYESSAELNVNDISNPTSTEIEIKNGFFSNKSYKLKGERVPKESITFKLSASQNSRLKEVELHVSRINKWTLKFVTNEGLDINGYIDPYSPNVKGHIQIDSPTKGYSHTGDLEYLKSEEALIWDSKTTKSGRPYITIKGQLSCRNKTFLNVEKVRNADEVSKIDFYYEKGVYALDVDTSKFTGFLRGEKKFGKLGFLDRVRNYEHTSNFSIENGVLTVKSISNKDKETFTRFDANVGSRYKVSNITLITPTISSQLIINPSGQKKVVNFYWKSPRYDQKTLIEVIPRRSDDWFESEPFESLKVESLSEHKVDPLERFKINALVVRDQESTVSVSIPHFELNVRKTVGPKPQYIFNTTINGYNEIEEYDIDKNLNPIENLAATLIQHSKAYISMDDD